MATVTGEVDISSPKVSILAIPMKFSASGSPDTAFYKTLFILDNKPLTNHGRNVSFDLNQVFVENRNWNAQKSRYYKKQTSTGRRSFNITWTNLPNSRYNTVDYGYARDFIKTMAEDPDVHVLKVLNDDSSGLTPYTETSYNVYVRDYSESLIRRDISNNIYLWECSLALEEA